MLRFILILALGISSMVFGQKKEILAVMNEQQEAWNRGDLSGYMQGYWKNEALVFIGSRGPTYGWEKTLENYKKSYPTKEKMGQLSFSEVHIRALGKKHAWVMGRWKLERENDAPEGVFTLVFEKFSDGWKIISDHTQ